MLCRLLTNRVDMSPVLSDTNRVDMFRTSYEPRRHCAAGRGLMARGEAGFRGGRGVLTMAESTPNWLQWSKGECLSELHEPKLFAYSCVERPSGHCSLAGA